MGLQRLTPTRWTSKLKLMNTWLKYLGRVYTTQHNQCELWIKESGAWRDEPLSIDKQTIPEITSTTLATEQITLSPQFIFVVYVYFRLWRILSRQLGNIINHINGSWNLHSICGSPASFSLQYNCNQELQSFNIGTLNLTVEKNTYTKRETAEKEQVAVHSVMTLPCVFQPITFF